MIMNTEMKRFAKSKANAFCDMVIKGNGKGAKAEFSEMARNNYAGCGGYPELHLLICQLVPLYIGAKLGRISRQETAEAQNAYFSIYEKAESKGASENG